MLQKIRSGSRTWVGVAMAVFLMIMFGFIGMNEFAGQGGGTPTSTVITVGDGGVNGRTYESEYRRVTNQLTTAQKRQITYADAKKEGILARISQALIENSRYEQEVEALGIQVPLQAVVQILGLSSVAYPIQSQNDPRYIFQQMVRGGLSQGQAAERVQMLIARSQLEAALGGVGSAPKSIVDRLYKLRNERRVAEVVLVPVTAVKTVPEPTQAQIQDFYKKNGEKYRVPNLRAVTALIVKPKDADAEIKISSDVIQKTYEARKADFTDPERREVHQIVVKDEAVAKKAMAALMGGRNFDTVAKEIAKTEVKSLGLLSVVELKALPVKALAERALTLEKGQVAGPFKSPFGWHLIVLVDIKAPKLKPLEEVRGQIVEDIRKRERPKVLGRMRDRIDDDVTAGNSLEVIAKSLKLEVRKIPAIDAQGRDERGAEIANLPDKRQFLGAVFSQRRGFAGNIIDTRADGGFFIVRVDKITNAQIPPLESIAKRVTEDWKEQRRRELARELAEKVAKEIRAGKAPADIAKAHGLTARTTTPLTRGAADATGTGETYIQGAVFTAGMGDVVIGRSPVGWAVAKVTKILEPEAKSAETAKKKINESMRSTWGTAVLEGFERSLAVRYPAEIDHEGIEKLLNRQAGR